MARYEIALAPEVQVPPPTVERLKRQLIAVVATLATVPASSELRTSVQASAFSIRIDDWRFVYTIDTRRARSAVIDAAPSARSQEIDGAAPRGAAPRFFPRQSPRNLWFSGLFLGGAWRDRTADLRHAIAALSQLS